MIRKLVIVFFGAIALWLFVTTAIIRLPVMSKASGERLWARMCNSQLSQLGNGLKSYHLAVGYYPPPVIRDARGRPLYSWRVPVLARYTEDPLLRYFHRDEPLTSRTNRAIFGPPCGRTMVRELHCPADEECPSCLSYVMVVGLEKTMTAASRAAYERGELQPALVEMYDSGVHWAEPFDIDVDTILHPVAHSNLAPRSRHPGGFHVCDVKGHIEFVPNGTPPEKLLAILRAEEPSEEP